MIFGLFKFPKQFPITFSSITKVLYLINFNLKVSNDIFTFSTVNVENTTPSGKLSCSQSSKAILPRYRATLTSLGSLTYILLFSFILEFFFARETQSCNSKLVIFSVESLESEYSDISISSSWFTTGVTYFSLISSCENLDQSIVGLDARSDAKSSVMTSRELVG